jgi:5-methyltetrahydrofolate--homocysteine methyltransferase
MDEVLPLAAERKTRLVGLLMDEGGLPQGVDDRVALAGKIIRAAERAGIGIGKLYLDPCVQPVSTSPDQAGAVVESVRKIMAEFPGVHTLCGLSNISFGLPYRSILNRVYLAYLIQAGMDGAVLDPTEGDVMATVLAAEALSGKDAYCMNYIAAERSGRLRPDVA